MKCSFPSCGRSVRARGLCIGHLGQERSGKALTPLRAYKQAGRTDPDPSASEVLSADDDWEQFRQWLGIRKRRGVAKKPALDRRHGVRRFLVISDLHVPFHNLEAVTEAVEQGIRDKVDTCIIAGDFVDCYSLSRFVQYEAVPIKEEFVKARTILEYASRNFTEVILLTGNHEERERKHFYQRLSQDEADWLLSKPMLERISFDMANVTLAHRRLHDTDIRWFVQIGTDAVIGHPEVSSSVALKPADKFRQWAELWSDVYGFGRPRLLVIGHTHQAGTAWVGNCLIVENGCLCRFQGYALTPKLYGKPQRLAFTRFDQKDGKTIMASVRQYYPFADHPSQNASH